MANLKVKLLSSGKSLTPYISRVVTGGRVQKAFAEQIGRPAGACVRSNVRPGMSQADIRKAVANCGSQHRGTRLSL